MICDPCKEAANRNRTLPPTERQKHYCIDLFRMVKIGPKLKPVRKTVHGSSCMCQHRTVDPAGKPRA